MGWLHVSYSDDSAEISSLNVSRPSTTFTKLLGVPAREDSAPFAHTRNSRNRVPPALPRSAVG